MSEEWTAATVKSVGLKETAEYINNLMQHQIDDRRDRHALLEQIKDLKEQLRQYE